VSETATPLRGLTWDHPRGYASVVAASQEWSRRGGAAVSWTARSLKAFGDQPLAEVASEVDLLVIDHPHVAAGVKAGALLELDGRGTDAELAGLRARSVGRSHDTYLYEGHLYALAIDAAAQVAAWRPDLIGDVPVTWEHVYSVARTGRVLWPAAPTDAISTFLTMAAALGSPACALADGFVDPAVGEQVLSDMHRLTELVPAWCLSANPIDVAEALASDDAYVYSPLLFGYSNYSRLGFRRSRLCYSNMPVDKSGRAPRGSCLGGAGIAVSARTGQPAEAVSLALWLASEQCQRGTYYWSGGQPANAAAWEDQAINADCAGFFSSTRASLEGSWARPPHPRWPMFQERAGELISEALLGEASDKATLAALDELYQDLLGVPEPT